MGRYVITYILWCLLVCIVAVNVMGWLTGGLATILGILFAGGDDLYDYKNNKKYTIFDKIWEKLKIKKWTNV